VADHPSPRLDETLIVLSTKPLVAESPLNLQSEKLTPNGRFFIRTNFGIPEILPESWNATVSGHVARPTTINLETLKNLPTRYLTAAMECAGNGRSFLAQPWEGNPFTYGAVSAASWTGVRLADVLQSTGLGDAVGEIVFVGADAGFEKKVGKEIPFERSLPIEIALHPDTLLVYEMNGVPLPAEHGGPVRLLVPGWYGVASVKWVAEIKAIEGRFKGFFQFQKYILPNGTPDPTPLTERRVRALITSPTADDKLVAGPHDVRGLAWSGNQPVQTVELSDDDGASWRTVDLEPSDSPYGWQRWRTRWQAQPGVHSLKVRATDCIGRVQPDVSDWNLLGYANNAVQVVAVTVASAT
jgi:DMSO/TMAO reductase YedYZ molybdopterin-dependent catalytic subunit